MLGGAVGGPAGPAGGRLGSIGGCLFATPSKPVKLHNNFYLLINVGDTRVVFLGPGHPPYATIPPYGYSPVEITILGKGLGTKGVPHGRSIR